MLLATGALLLAGTATGKAVGHASAAQLPSSAAAVAPIRPHIVYFLLDDAGHANFG
jgi:hypothetical protein